VSTIKLFHPESDFILFTDLLSFQVKDQCKKLKEAWKELEKAAEDRNKRLELALKAQQFFNDSSEVETWMNEKNSLLSSTDYGKDKDASVKFLTKHKVTYRLQYLHFLI